MDFWVYALVVLTGLVSGFINTLAGSGSLLTLPLLIFLGLPANVANGTNRIAILMQSAVAVQGFKKAKIFEWKEGIWLAIPATVGSFFGAAMASNINELMLNRIIGGLMIIMLLLMVIKPERWIKPSGSSGRIKLGPIQIVVFFAIGFYGGFIQVGIGFFMLAGLVLSAGLDLLKANALKVLIISIYTVIALSVFIFNEQVNYTLGLIMGVGSMAGAWIATRMAIKRGSEFIRWFLIVVVLGFSVKLLFF
jgi:hypothetical protein